MQVPRDNFGDILKNESWNWRNMVVSLEFRHTGLPFIVIASVFRHSEIYSRPNFVMVSLVELYFKRREDKYTIYNRNHVIMFILNINM